MNRPAARKPPRPGMPENRLPGLPVAMLFVLSFLMPACVEKEMTLKDAKQVTVQVSQKTFSAPPRRVDDILDLLNQPSRHDRKIVSHLYAQAEKAPPDTDNPQRLAAFYFERGRAARELGRYRRSLEDLRKSNRYKEDPFTLRLLSTAEALAGNFNNAIAYVKRSHELKERSSNYFLMALYHSWTGDLAGCEKTVQTGLDYIRTARLGSAKPSPWLTIDQHRLQATLYHSRGQFAAAEASRRKAAGILKSFIKKHPMVYLHNKGRLDMNLAFQGRLIEAELGARETLNEAIGLTGKTSGTTADSILNLGEILLMQGRLEDAEKLVRAGIRLFENGDIPREAAWFGEARSNLVKTLCARQNYAEAASLIDAIRTDMRANSYAYEKFVARNPDMMVPLIMTNRAKEALAAIESAYAALHRYLGDDHYQTAEMLGLRGMAHAALGDRERSLQDFDRAVPMLLKEKGPGRNYLKTLRLQIITESYIDLLAGLYADKKIRQLNPGLPARIFELCEALNDSRVKRALGASGARAAALNSDLSDLVRREQDALVQIESLEQTLSGVLAARPGQVDPGVAEELRTAINALTRARKSILAEIKNHFPRYNEFVNPRPPVFAALQRSLQTGESLIVIHPGRYQTFIWAIPQSGPVVFAAAPRGRDELEASVRRLRHTLAPTPTTFGDIPDYDLSRGYDLYASILKPVASGWKEARDLVIVANAPLGAIPFGVLPTEPTGPPSTSQRLFEKYRRVPWLIRAVSITRLPSAASLVTLRALPAGDSRRRAFIGFGDPVFNAAQRQSQTISANGEAGPIKVRGIRVTAQATLDAPEMISTHIGMLNRLPDTAAEIAGIAETLNADSDQDVFLGEKATEQRVKSIDLSNRKVVAFATHGLVPGDLDGLDQPALALCGPEVTRDGEDGLLTTNEILKLKLNADWVVLSACNTGAADGAGSEAVSGLGRAFFYAGSRSLLVSMWPVESTSAGKLTTRLFHYQGENPKLSRARALQKAMLDLIDRQLLKDKPSGRVVATYAHPFFWAPFTIFGDGG